MGKTIKIDKDGDHGPQDITVPVGDAGLGCRTMTSANGGMTPKLHDDIIQKMLDLGALEVFLAPRLWS